MIGEDIPPQGPETRPLARVELDSPHLGGLQVFPDKHRMIRGDGNGLFPGVVTTRTS
jgi:hypothetical protein